MFKHTLFVIMLAVAGLALGCNPDMRKRIPGSYLTEIQDYESTCTPGSSGPPDGTRLLVRIDAVSETTFNFTFATGEEPLVIPDAAVDEDGNFSTTYSQRVPNIYNEFLYDLTGNVTPDLLTATLTLYILPVPGNGTEPVCFASITVSGPRCEGACTETN